MVGEARLARSCVNSQSAWNKPGGPRRSTAQRLGATIVGKTLTFPHHDTNIKASFIKKNQQMHLWLFMLHLFVFLHKTCLNARYGIHKNWSRPVFSACGSGWFTSSKICLYVHFCCVCFCFFNDTLLFLVQLSASFTGYIISHTGWLRVTYLMANWINLACFKAW